MLGRYGTLELFAQCHELHTVSPFGVVSSNITLPLLVAQKADASTTFNALETSCPELKIESIVQLAEKVPYVFFQTDQTTQASTVLLRNTSRRNYRKIVCTLMLGVALTLRTVLYFAVFLDLTASFSSATFMLLRRRPVWRGTFTSCTRL